MGHRLGSLLLILNVLFCPLLCGASASVCDQTEATTSPSAPCCPHCRNAASDMESQDLPAPASDDSTSCCYCGGAVLSQLWPDECPVGDAQECLLTTLIPTGAPQSGDVHGQPECDERTLPTGSVLRLAECSLRC